MFDVRSGYYRHLGIPIRLESRQAYVMRPLENRLRKGTTSGHITTAPEDQRYVFQVTFHVEEIMKDFVFKMFSLLFLQFLVIGIVIFLCITVADIRKFVKKNPRVWQGVGAGGGVIYLVLALSVTARSVQPSNLILVSLMVISLAFVLGSVAAIYNLLVVMYAIVVESCIVIFVAILVKFAPCDVAGCSMIFCVLGTTIIAFGVIASLVWLLTRFSIIHLLVAGVTVVALSLYLLFDTQTMVQGKVVQPGESVKGNIHLYVDLLLMFFWAARALCGLLCRRCGVAQNSPAVPSRGRLL